MNKIKPTLVLLFNLLTRLVLFMFFVINLNGFAQTYTSIQDGDWTSASTWSGGSIPPTTLANKTVNIDHRVTYNGTIKLNGNSTININYIFRFYGGSLEMEEATDVVNIDHGLLVVPNGLFLNKAGIVNLDYGRIQLCNSSYKDESSSPNGTFGIGDIYADNGSIENVNPGGFSSDIEWCITGGSPLNLPNSQDCSVVAPPPGFICTDELLYEPAKVDFDGIDDYLDSETDLVGLQNATIMAWAKLSDSFSNQGYIVGQPNFNILVNDSEELVVTANGASITITSTSIDSNIWTHVAAIYEASHPTEKLRVYINGVKVGSLNTGGTIGSSLQNTSLNFTIGRKPGVSLDYFKGAIDEVRVFDIALTDSQLGQMIYQEIEKNGNNVKGVIIPKEIKDFETNNTVSWSNLVSYYPMTRGLSGLSYSVTLDHSKYNKRATINNITTRELQTAPMPYETISDGFGLDETTWRYGDFWNLDALVETEYSIVKISHDVTLDDDLKTLGLIIDSGKTLVTDDTYEINNSWYLELNGTIDLKDDSQLIQTNTSDLVTDIDGKILRRQEGTNSKYWYNYFGSPVGIVGATSLTDNNTASNNSNNSSFNIDMIKDGMGTDIEFTTAYHETGKLSTYWFYTYQNGVTYWNWSSFNPSTQINPGVGYIHKGTGTIDPEQQYIFEGKPNNGTIVINAIDTGGAGSVPAVSKTDYLLANPYPSALDLHQFIDDNVGVIDGDLQLWQQWSGSSHVLNEYNGGYATVNKLGSIKAYQFVGIEGANNGSQDGTLAPTRYLPVAQGFMAEIVADGNIVFNNNQRVFIKEADADGTYNNGSQFFRSSNNANNNSNTSSDKISLIRMYFNAINGPSRELLLGFSDITSDDFDYGYDAINHEDLKDDDLNLSFGEDKMTIQAYSQIIPEKTVPLIFKSSGNYTYEISAMELTNISNDLDILLKDKLTDVYHNLRSDQTYSFTSEAGTFINRFEVEFKSKEIEPEEDLTDNGFFIYVDNTEEKLQVKGLKESVLQLNIVNILGQTIKIFNNVESQTLDNGINISDLSSGIYLVNLMTENNSHLSKKIILD